MRFPFFKRRKNRRGANALEFALTLPIFLVICFGMMEFGNFFTKRALVNSIVGKACREAALIDPINPPAGSVNGACGGEGDDCIELTAEEEMNTRITAAGLTCTSCEATVSGTLPARLVTCEMEVQHTDLTGFFNAFFPTSFETKTNVRLEWQRLAT